MALKNSQYDTIIRTYNQRQAKNKYNLDLKTKEIYETIPEISSIDQELAIGSINTAKLILTGKLDTLDKLKNKNLELSMKKIELLIEHNYPSNYLMPSYHCNICKDSGYVENEKCTCFKQAIVDLLYKQSNIKHILEQENFSTFSTSYYSTEKVDSVLNITPYDNILRVLNICKNFVSNFNNQFNNLLFYGNTGVGKTFLSNCIAKELLDLSYTVIYLTSFELFDLLEKNKFRKNEEPEESIEQFQYILDCDLLIIDDLGTELINQFIISQLFLCINERYLRQKSTIISTNLSLANLNEEYTERIFSRISSNYIMLKIIGDDIRLKKTFSK